jgi:prepilin-type processing-associated H-X9-DG protein
MFSVEINHGGYFVGSGSNIAYVDGLVICYDHVDTVTWSPLMVENLIEEIGYEMKGE